MGAKNITFALK